jgi:hypothetical protein
MVVFHLFANLEITTVGMQGRRRLHSGMLFRCFEFSFPTQIVFKTLVHIVEGDIVINASRFISV